MPSDGMAVKDYKTPAPLLTEVVATDRMVIVESSRSLALRGLTTPPWSPAFLSSDPELPRNLSNLCAPDETGHEAAMDVVILAAAAAFRIRNTIVTKMN